jgi:hypothetical protein
MSHNDSDDYARRLYALLPGHYRAYDQEQGGPLRALMQVIGAQAANVRADIDSLWDNFFIETCDDWVVPYLGALVGTNLLASPVGRSNRLDVRDTTRWRRLKGTPALLREVAGAIGGWPAGMAEFFQGTGWSQDLNHLRLDRPLTPELRATGPLGRLGRVDDPYAHAADFRPSGPFDQPRHEAGRAPTGTAAWGTPGRYQLKNIGVFVNRLMAFPIQGGTPAPAFPTVNTAASASCYSFDPLSDPEPIFSLSTGDPITRAAFGEAPWNTYGSSFSIRQFGVLLASDVPPSNPAGFPPDPNQTPVAYSFGNAGAGLSLDPASGLRLMDLHVSAPSDLHFVISAVWLPTGGANPVTLGSLSTLHAAQGAADAFRPGAATGGAGRLVIQIETGRPGLGWTNLPASRRGRFPGGIVAVRAARTGPLRMTDALNVALPSARLSAQGLGSFFVAVDGSTYGTTDLNPTGLARASIGSVFPPRGVESSQTPAFGFTSLNRTENGLHVADPSRFGGTGVLFLIQRLDLDASAQPVFTTIAGIATAAQAASPDPALAAPSPWPALLAVPATKELSPTPAPSPTLDGRPSPRSLLSISVLPLSAASTFSPACELIVVNRQGRSLLVYLPEIGNLTSAGQRFLVADEGSTYADSNEVAERRRVVIEGSLAGLQLARTAQGQILPIAGAWPLQQRRPVVIDLCRSERAALVRAGELGIDPELGRFSFAAGDPALSQPGLSVDYAEAFGDRVGSRSTGRNPVPVDVGRLRLVNQLGDVPNPGLTADRLHRTLSDALQKAVSGDVIEIADSAAYGFGDEVMIPATLKSLTIRAAAGQRPCLAFFDSQGNPARSSFRVSSSMDSLTLDGLFISGGPLRIETSVVQLNLSSCTLDPRTAGAVGSLVAPVAAGGLASAYQLTRCITGPLKLGPGVFALTVADSIVDALGGLAIGGVTPLSAGSGTPASPTGSTLIVESSAPSVQLERVTVIGRVRSSVLLASECLITGLVMVDDRQAGCFRYSRYERGSILPRRFQSVPAESDPSRLPARFVSLQFGRPGYAQLAAGCPPEILAASEDGSEVGAFTLSKNPTRLGNLRIKVQEFLPVGLSVQIIALT